MFEITVTRKVEVSYSGKSNQCKGDDGNTENTVRGGGGGEQSIVLKSRHEEGEDIIVKKQWSRALLLCFGAVGEKTKRCRKDTDLMMCWGCRVKAS